MLSTLREFYCPIVLYLYLIQYQQLIDNKLQERQVSMVNTRKAPNTLQLKVKHFICYCVNNYDKHFVHYVTVDAHSLDSGAKSVNSLHSLRLFLTVWCSY